MKSHSYKGNVVMNVNIKLSVKLGCYNFCKFHVRMETDVMIRSDNDNCAKNHFSSVYQIFNDNNMHDHDYSVHDVTALNVPLLKSSSLKHRGIG